MPTRKTILLLLRYNMYTRRKKQQLSHELSRFGQFIAMQKSRQGLDLHRSKRNFRARLGEDTDLEMYEDSFDTFHDELFGRFYEDSQELEQPVQWSKDIHDLLDDCREFQSLQLTVDKKLKISSDSSVSIQTDGLFGSKFLVIEIGGMESYMKDGDAFSFAEDSMLIQDLLKNIISIGEKNKL